MNILCKSLVALGVFLSLLIGSYFFLAFVTTPRQPTDTHETDQLARSTNLTQAQQSAAAGELEQHQLRPNVSNEISSIQPNSQPATQEAPLQPITSNQLGSSTPQESAKASTEFAASSDSGTSASSAASASSATSPAAPETSVSVSVSDSNSNSNASSNTSPNSQLVAESGSSSSAPSSSATVSEMYREVTRTPIEHYDISEQEKTEWQQFQAKYKLSFRDETEAMRRQEIFIGNLRFIEAFNRLPNYSFKLGMNFFGHLTQEETNQFYIGRLTNWSQTIGQQQAGFVPPPPIKILSQTSGAVEGGSLGPSNEVDYRGLESGPPVNQGNCLESSIFAVVASLEAKINEQLKQSSPNEENKMKLSEQQLITCLGKSGAPVCSSGVSMFQVFEYLQRSQLRLASFQEYADFMKESALGQRPDSETCDIMSMNSSAKRPRLNYFTQVHRDNLDEALQNTGPQVVAIDASKPTFHFYKSGVYHEADCSQEAYNFHLLLVGQQQQQQQQQEQQEQQEQLQQRQQQQQASLADQQVAVASQENGAAESHYLARASLGTEWGENGYIRLAKDPAKNKCLPQNFAIYPNDVLA